MGEAEIGKSRPSRFLVVPGSSRTVPALKSTWDHVSPFTSPMRQPVRQANSIAGAYQSGNCASTSRTSSSEKKPFRTLSSLSVGRGGFTGSWPASTASFSIRLSAAISW